MHPYTGETIEPGDLVRRNVGGPTPSMMAVKIDGSEAMCEWPSPLGTLRGDFPVEQLVLRRG